MRIREECGGTREELLSSNTKLSKSLRVISERIRVGNTATPHQEVPHPTPGVSWPRYLGRVSREASGETNQRVPEQPASGDVDSIGNDLPCLTDGSNEGITTQSTNKPKRAREVPALEAEAERSDGSTYKRQRSTILPGCTTAHYGGVDGTASDQYNQQQPHTYGEMPTPPLSGHELDECSMSMSQEAIQATEAHMGEVGQPFPTSINSLHSSASRVLSCNTVQHFGGTTNQPIPDPSGRNLSHGSTDGEFHMRLTGSQNMVRRLRSGPRLGTVLYTNPIRNRTMKTVLSTPYRPSCRVLSTQTTLKMGSDVMLTGIQYFNLILTGIQNSNPTLILQCWCLSTGTTYLPVIVRRLFLPCSPKNICSTYFAVPLLNLCRF